MVNENSIKQAFLDIRSKAKKFELKVKNLKIKFFPLKSPHFKGKHILSSGVAISNLP